MLSRIANSLFWMGRYLERAEHLARYSKEQVVSSVDAPRVVDQQQMQRSILYMSGAFEEYQEKYEILDTSDVFHFTTFDAENTQSIMFCVTAARENARSARATLSTEGWEAINKLYHLIKDHSVKLVSKRSKVYEYYQEIIESCYIIKGILVNTQLRNDPWSIINAGYLIENSIQVTRIVHTKLHDIAHSEKRKLNDPVRYFHLASLLRSFDSLDSARKYYKASLTRNIVIDFLILNKIYPNSVYSTLKLLNKQMNYLNPNKRVVSKSVEFVSGKLEAKLKFMVMKDLAEMEDDVKEFVGDLKEELYSIGEMFQEKYLN